MEIKQLIPDLKSWVNVIITANGDGDAKKLIAFDRSVKPKSREDNQGWTYIYTVDGTVKYIGNTGTDLKTRVLSELNQKAAIKGIRNSKKDLGYTNIRLSQLLLTEIEDKKTVHLYYTNEFKWNKLYQEDKLIVNCDSNFCFDHKFLLFWHPRILQGISDDISIETALILRHIQVGNQLPPWNLGLG